ncbi:zf-HC2 domain-containing protein [Accumulibacter sp.]|uniref:zf-HC2 domain-containing protein n=1 Tax=Accumulibacter sp. TaxID=2053492 RepID=UPI00260C2707|nr:zf-HC2 domain-containing protein [Accumulibacter sp.]
MLSCKEATRLMSEAQDRPLSRGEKLLLEMHLAMCRGCRNFRTQMDFLRLACRQFMRRWNGQDDGSPPP